MVKLNPQPLDPAPTLDILDNSSENNGSGAIDCRYNFSIRTVATTPSASLLGVRQGEGGLRGLGLGLDSVRVGFRRVR